MMLDTRKWNTEQHTRTELLTRRLHLANMCLVAFRRDPYEYIDSDTFEERKKKGPTPEFTAPRLAKPREGPRRAARGLEQPPPYKMGESSGPRTGESAAAKVQSNPSDNHQAIHRSKVDGGDPNSPPSYYERPGTAESDSARGLAETLDSDALSPTDELRPRDPASQDSRVRHIQV